jgi:hypothetical protein
MNSRTDPDPESISITTSEIEAGTLGLHCSAFCVKWRKFTGPWLFRTNLISSPGCSAPI